MDYFLLIVFTFYTIAVARIWFLFGAMTEVNKLLMEVSTYYPEKSSEDEKWAKLLIKEE